MSDDTAEIPLPDMPEVEPVDIAPADDERPRKSRRPTTRAGRRAYAESVAGKKDKAPRSSAPKPRTKPLAQRIENFYNTVGIGISMSLGMEDGLAVTNNAKTCAAAWENAAASNPAIAEAWERILGVSVLGDLFMAHAPIMVTIAANHGLVPPGMVAMMGGTPPEPAADFAGAPPASWPASAADGGVPPFVEPEVVPAWANTNG